MGARARLMLGAAAALAGVGAARADDPPTPFSRAVTAAVPDWEAEDWRRGVLKLHPSRYTWQSDTFLELLPEEPVAGRTPEAALQAAYGDVEINDRPVPMQDLQQIAPGVVGRFHRWAYAGDDNFGIWGTITTPRGYVVFHSVCDKADTDYGGEQCVAAVSRLLVHLQRGDLKVPEPPAPLNVPGWEASYRPDGTSVAVNRSWNGLREARVYASPPSVIGPDALPAAIGRFADAIVDEDDKAPGPIQWVGTTADPWIRREFPAAFEGPVIQMAGSVRLPDGRVSLVGVRCPNKGWLKACAFGVDRTRDGLRWGEVERRRQAVIAATRVPLPANGLKDADIVGLWTEGRQTMGAGGFMTGYVVDAHLYLRDGSVRRDFGKPPAFIDPVASKRDEPGDWGRWTRAGDKLVVTWADGDRDEVPDTGDNQMVGGTPGMRFAGRFRHVSGGGTMAFGGGSSFLSESEYRFHADGTFDSARSGSFTVGAGPGAEGAVAVGGGGGPGGRGRYRVDGYTLTLTYPDGRISRLSFAAYKHDLTKGAPGGLMLNGTFYFRDDD